MRREPAWAWWHGRMGMGGMGNGRMGMVGGGMGMMGGRHGQ